DPLTFNYSLPSEAKLDSLFIFPQLDPITLEIGLFLDSKLFEHFQREYIRDAEQHLLDFSLALINNVHVLYQQSSMSPNLDIVIVRYELWKTQPIGLDTLTHRNGQAQTLLNGFCRHQAAINPGTDLTDPGHWDHGILLTGYDIYHTTTSVAGVAPVARMCDEIFACSLVEGLHLGRSFVLAHEMGHNMGMVHDGIQNQCSRSCCLMSAVNGAGKTTWSPCSVREFNAFLLQLDESGRGNCLRDAAESISTHDHLKDGRLPGQRFTADQQCSYFWGKDYQVEIPNGRKMDDICRILWCGNSGSTISTAHPALEGSWCGGDKFCVEGQCREWRYGPKPSPIHGGWSEWSGGDRRCPVSQCQISGSIQLKSQMRTCTSPAPNNGGKPCAGSSFRGLVCGSVQSSCEGVSRLEYGTRLCTSIKNDPIKPDPQLSGATFLHGTQPCKVWCHLIDSELIRNKGQYPDGSPCGVSQYCIGGSCLTLSCNNEAVVNDPNDCPQSAITPVEVSQMSEWNEWSPCSASCGANGIQKRQRSCSSPADVGIQNSGIRQLIAAEKPVSPTITRPSYSIKRLSNISGSN
uniref:Peptidase M12B domain-containing protein n=1 Tax=Parascaris univalens TaxID=6257 RepID=A0A915A817_PARUN